MNKQEILELPAGREMDALVTKTFFEPCPPMRPLPVLRSMSRDEWRYSTHKLDSTGGYWEVEIGTDAESVENLQWEPAQKASTEIVGAFWVVQGLRAMNYNVRIELHKTYTEVVLWQRNMNEHGPLPITCHADTVYLAVCRAALLAVMDDSERTHV